MTFKAYLDNIEAQTGKSPAELKNLAAKEGFMIGDKLRPDVKAGQVVEWLKKDFQLGHGHAMAIVAFLKGKRV